jgi:uncharacterized membrane protein
VSLYEWLLFLHIVAAIVWIGGGVILQILGARLARSRDAEGMLKFTRDIEVLGPVSSPRPRWRSWGWGCGWSW